MATTDCYSAANKEEFKEYALISIYIETDVHKLS
jgi:hypothetical protein